eukprot:TRINITY_DN25317_c0_g1_i2.p2 TRINITY_DN25317_c0_g1~~TRINITY_DN25317_c0_g1_i2.p2  ORF type:complete len:174 (-),score=52.92 TRINITY_DN25317_c0_g1_i2:609-1130(-)
MASSHGRSGGGERRRPGAVGSVLFVAAGGAVAGIFVRSAALAALLPGAPAPVDERFRGGGFAWEAATVVCEEALLSPHDVDEAAAALRRDGFVLLKAALSPDLVDRCAEVFQRRLEARLDDIKRTGGNRGHHRQYMVVQPEGPFLEAAGAVVNDVVDAVLKVASTRRSIGSAW